ncbi:hypothetical protein N9M41_04725 [Rhodopirellula sp.]|nr:hypothetical protein [Rhodopirellula sp.]
MEGERTDEDASEVFTCCCYDPIESLSTVRSLGGYSSSRLSMIENVAARMEQSKTR